MRWFGKHWKAAVCDVLPHANHPGGDCFLCGMSITLEHFGFLVPSVEDDGTVKEKGCHAKCFKRAIFGKPWVDHEWEMKRVSLWSMCWTCKGCGVTVGKDPTKRDTRADVFREYRISKCCSESLVEQMQKL